MGYFAATFHEDGNGVVVTDLAGLAKALADDDIAPAEADEALALEWLSDRFEGFDIEARKIEWAGDKYHEEDFHQLVGFARGALNFVGEDQNIWRLEYRADGIHQLTVDFITWTERDPHDPFVVIRDGMVQNNPAAEVFDLDILDSDVPTADDYPEVVELKGRAVAAGIDYIVPECDAWLVEHAAWAPVTP